MNESVSLNAVFDVDEGGDMVDTILTIVETREILRFIFGRIPVNEKDMEKNVPTTKLNAKNLKDFGFSIIFRIILCNFVRIANETSE